MRRRIAIMLLLLAGGAVVNVAVAWGCAWWSNLEWGASGPVEDDGWIVAWLDARSAEYGGPNRQYRPVWHVDERGWGRRQVHLSATVISGHILMPADRTVVAAGWPVFAMEGDSTPEWTGTTYVHHQNSLVSVEVAGRERDTPLRPMFPGFIVNTVFYALLLWLIFLAPFAVQRMIRRRRGQCENCAYPIGGRPVCTECGAVVERG